MKYFSLRNIFLKEGELKQTSGVLLKFSKSVHLAEYLFHGNCGKGNAIYKINIGTKWFILLPATQTKNYIVKKDTTFILLGEPCIYSARKKQYILDMSMLCIYKNAFEVFLKNHFFFFLNL